MSLNERKTEAIVRNHFQKFLDKVIIEEQKSDSPKIKKLLLTASKNGNGIGHPEFIIQYKNNPDFIIIVECKADITKHESKSRDKYKDYAVDGVLLYSSYISRDYDILAIAISGDENNYKVSHFLQLKNTKEAHSIFNNDKLLSVADYENGYKTDERKFNQDFFELLRYSKNLNDKLHTLKIPESQRSLLIAGSLIALKDKAFYASYKLEQDPKKLVNTYLDTIKTQLLNVENKNIEEIITTFSFVKTHTILSKEVKIFKDIIIEIDEKINSFIKNYQYFDTLGQFYIEFLRYANNDKGLGIVLTPPHITQLFCELANVNRNSIILDNCTGTGGFLISAMQQMMRDAGGDSNKEKEIKAKQIIGIELQHDIFTLLCSNMFIHGDGRSNLFKGSCFDEKIKEEVKKFKPNVGFLNPPYKGDKNDIEEMQFILNNLSFLEKGSYCIAIVPMSCALAQSGDRLALKQQLLEYHTLDAVLSMPNELFKNSNVGVNTCIMIFKAKEKHLNNYKTYFAYCKDDGFINKKTEGRADYSKMWNGIKKKWVDSFRNRDEIVGFSIKKEVKAESEWCVEAYMNSDYAKLIREDFENAIINQLSFLFLRKYKVEILNESVIKANFALNVNNWKEFCINDLFNFRRGKRITKLFAQKNVGNIPVIAGGAENHGVLCYLDEKLKNEYIFQDKCFTVSAYGSAGSVIYHNYKCFIDDKALSFVSKNEISIYACLFLEVLLNLEKSKYAYGRGVIENRYKETIIKLPSKNGQPDFEFMENYIKSLPYSLNL